MRRQIRGLTLLVCPNYRAASLLLLLFSPREITQNSCIGKKTESEFLLDAEKKIAAGFLQGVEGFLIGSHFLLVKKHFH